MKFLAITYGTEGDTRPIAALCRALIDSGHDVRLLASDATLGSAREMGVPSDALAGDIRGMARPGGEISNVVERGDRFSSVATTLAHIANLNAEAWLQAAVEAGRDRDALLVSGLAGFAGLSAAEHLRIPAIGVGLIPISPTSAFPSPFLPPRWIPAGLNRVSHHFVNGMLWRAFRKAVNRARVRICGLEPRRSVWSGHPMLYGVSPSLLPRPADWPANAYMCGQWTAASMPWEPPQALNEFLDAGEPPIYVGFGSMMGVDHEKLLETIIGATEGRRTLIYPGWSGMTPADLPSNFFVLGDTPHQWLFPRTSLVVHHGGSGTSHSAARAGVPAVVVPFAADQFFWAHRLQALGIAEAIPAKALTQSALAAGMEAAMRTDVGSRARQVGERMRAEDGVAAALSAIRSLTARPR
jgi:sterol 3beta-glucosyltransferase